MTGDNRKANIAIELAQSNDAMRAAEALLALDLLRDAANRLYYALYHAARAVLLSEGLEAKSHKGLVSLFGLHFIVPGKLLPELNETFIRIQGYREASDYVRGFEPTRAEFERNLEATKEFLLAVEKFIVAGGWR